MKSFLEFLKESVDTHVLAFGRMNPPTSGHMKVIDTVRNVANQENASHSVVVSHSNNPKNNPLTKEQKIKHLKRYSPTTNFNSASKEFPTILHHVSNIYNSGKRNLIVVAGSDRVDEYKKLLDKYNGQTAKHGHYNFDSIRVISSGKRDPDSEGTDGMSGTKMRQYASENNFHEFRKGVPEHVSDKHAKELMNDVRYGMKLEENLISKIIGYLKK